MPLPLSPTRPRLVLHKGDASPCDPIRPHACSAANAPAIRCLASLTIDGLPHALFERIVESAAANHRSIVGEVIARLETAFGSSRPPADSMLARVRAIRSRIAIVSSRMTVAPASPARPESLPRAGGSPVPGPVAGAHPIEPVPTEPGAS